MPKQGQSKISSSESARSKILDAALTVIRTKGYSATSVDLLCETAGVTKGAFFHHFKSKEDLAIAAAEHWSKITSALFENAPYQSVEEPLNRLLSYIEFRKNLLQGPLPDFTCLAGTMVQEVYSVHPKIQGACRDSIFGHAHTLESTITAAQKKYAAGENWSPVSLALYIQGSIQGALILAKASGDAQIAVACLEHLERYVRLLFSKPH